MLRIGEHYGLPYVCGVATAGRQTQHELEAGTTCQGTGNNNCRETVSLKARVNKFNGVKIKDTTRADKQEGDLRPC